MFSPFFKHLLWRNSLKLKGTHLFRLGSAQHEGAAVTWTASTCVCFPFSFPPLGHQPKMESIRLYSSLVGNYSPESHCQSSSPIFFPISLHQPPCQAQTFPQFFFSSWFPASRCPSNLGWYKWEECSRGGQQSPSPMLMSQGWAGAAARARGHCLCLPESAQAQAGTGLCVPNLPAPDQALEQSRCCPHPREQGRGECRGKEALPSGRTARTAHTNSAAGPGICSRLWSCKYLPLLPLKTCPRG